LDADAKRSKTEVTDNETNGEEAKKPLSAAFSPALTRSRAEDRIQAEDSGEASVKTEDSAMETGEKKKEEASNGRWRSKSNDQLFCQIHLPLY